MMNAAMNKKDQQRHDQRNLMKALESNDYKSVRMMIKQKSMDLNFIDIELYCSPLMFEATKKFPSIEMIRYLLDHGGRVNFSDWIGMSGMTALHLLMRNQKSRSSIAPCITFLLSRGANPNAIDMAKDSPLHTACLCGNTKAVRCLLSFYNDGRDQISTLKKEGMTDDNLQMIDVNCINWYGDTPLMVAAKNGKVDVELVEILIKYKAEINLVNKKMWSALHYACQYGSSKVVNILLRRGADVNIVNHDDRTPLECACHSKDEKAAQSLLYFHADVNRQNRKFRTPLHLLAKVYRNSSCLDVDRCLCFLLAYGGNVNIQDHNGETPLSYAVRICLNMPQDFQQKAMMSQIVLLLEAATNSKGINIQLSKSILDFYVIGDTILHYAVKDMNVNMVNLILRYNPDLRLRNCHQETPRDVANNLYESDYVGCTKYALIELIEKKIEHLRVQSYSYMLQSWMMSDGEQEPLHQKKGLHGMTRNVPCPPSRKCRHT